MESVSSLLVQQETAQGSEASVVRAPYCGQCVLRSTVLGYARLPWLTRSPAVNFQYRHAQAACSRLICKDHSRFRRFCVPCRKLRSDREACHGMFPWRRHLEVGFGQPLERTQSVRYDCSQSVCYDPHLSVNLYAILHFSWDGQCVQPPRCDACLRTT